MEIGFGTWLAFFFHLNEKKKNQQLQGQENPVLLK